MNPRIALAFAVILCIAIAIAGCTGTPEPLVTTAPPASPAAATTLETGGGGAALVPTENDPLDAARSVTVNIEKDYLGIIRATFQGGPGLVHVRKIDVTVNRADGQVKTAPVGIEMDDSASIEGTKDTDRVMVFVTLSDGKTYKIFDDLVAFKPR
jgi:hypothetical protein